MVSAHETLNSTPKTNSSQMLCLHHGPSTSTVAHERCSNGTHDATQALLSHLQTQSLSLCFYYLLKHSGLTLALTPRYEPAGAAGSRGPCSEDNVRNAVGESPLLRAAHGVESIRARKKTTRKMDALKRNERRTRVPCFWVDSIARDASSSPIPRLYLS